MESDQLGSAPGSTAFTRRAAMRGGLGLAAALGLGNWRAMAQDATPSATAPVTLVAHRLTNPRGFAWDSNGDLYVSLAGSGGAGVLGPDSGDGYATTGHSGIVARIENGNPVAVSVDLPSTTVSGERTLGPAAVAFLGDALYVLEDANAMDFLRNSPDPDGVYRVNDDQSLTLIADTAAWISANPTKFKPADYNPGGEVFGMVTVGDELWVVESNNGQVMKVSLDGQIRADRRSLGKPSVANRACGISQRRGLRWLPYPGAIHRRLSPTVVEVAADGKVTEVWKGLTIVTAVAVAPDGTLYAAEMATGNIDKPPYIAPETGRIVRRTGADTLEEVATNINYPVALAFGPDGALYVAATALGSIDPDGYILRIDVSAKGPHDVRSVAATAGGRDFSQAQTDYFGGVTPAKDVQATAEPAAATETPATQEAAATETSGTPPAAAAANTVTMEAGNFYFKPKDVSIPAHTPVTFKITNVAQIPHNFSIDVLAISVALDPGTTTDVTVNAPAGTYQFYCNLPGHRAAGMEGTLTVS